MKLQPEAAKAAQPNPESTIKREDERMRLIRSVLREYRMR